MGVFDTFLGWSNCSHCEQYNRVDIQFKGLDPSMATYTVGDYVGGHEPYTILTSEDLLCETCEQVYTTYVLGNMGIVYGFCNEQDFNQIKKFLPFGKEETYVSFMVSKEWLERDPEEALKRLREAYMANPLETDFVVVDEQVDNQDMDQLICRIPSFVKDPNRRPNIGDTVYVDDRTSRYQLWRLQDEKATVIERVFQERTQNYVYSVQLRDGSVMKNIHESKLADEGRRQDLLAFLTKAEAEILSCWEMHNRPRDEKEERIFRFKKMTIGLHYKNLVEDLIEVGKLPEDFSVET